jgi:hypothetical protein
MGKTPSESWSLSMRAVGCRAVGCPSSESSSERSSSSWTLRSCEYALCAMSRTQSTCGQRAMSHHLKHDIVDKRSVVKRREPCRVACVAKVCVEPGIEWVARDAAQPDRARYDAVAAKPIHVRTFLVMAPIDKSRNWTTTSSGLPRWEIFPCVVKLGDASFFAHRSDYRRCGQIGKGVFGEVFRAEVLKHGREGQEVALKQLDLKVRGAAKLSRRRRWSFQSYSYEKSKCSLACDTRTSSD